MSRYRAVRGMTDILADDTPRWQALEAAARQILHRYGYREIRLPIIESTQLFARSIGEATDILEKEMYTFNDRKGDSISLRPEGTAGCARAVVEHGLITAAPKLWYVGPMFRYERPQKGRQRQFHQLGVEAFGISSPDLDTELLLLCRALWRELGIDDTLTLQINSIGNSESRVSYRAALVEYLSQHRDALDDDSKRRLETNPLRILDSKSPDTQAVLTCAPKILDALDDESRADFDRLRILLDAVGQPYTINQKLVRGLDYYNKTVFEWTTTALGAQGTVCGGGRYDGLVAQFGGKEGTAGAGFAVGLERLELLLKSLGNTTKVCADLYVITADEAAQQYALPRVEALRLDMPALMIRQHLGGGSLKSQFKRADKSGARFALVYGESEVMNHCVTLKPLRGEGVQVTIPADALVNVLSERLN